uniref:Uncharacterized protein n=1 Tax=Romanomermis culicivorax TaxID=13658 RepID=A0A915IA66_ROMCU
MQMLVFTAVVLCIFCAQICSSGSNGAQNLAEEICEGDDAVCAAKLVLLRALADLDLIESSRNGKMTGEEKFI